MNAKLRGKTPSGRNVLPPGGPAQRAPSDRSSPRTASPPAALGRISGIDFAESGCVNDPKTQLVHNPNTVLLFYTYYDGAPSMYNVHRVPKVAVPASSRKTIGFRHHIYRFQQFSWPIANGNVSERLLRTRACMGSIHLTNRLQRGRHLRAAAGPPNPIGRHCTRLAA